MSDKVDPDDVTTFRPEELGWVYKGNDVYELPDGKLYIFPPGRQHLVEKWMGPVPTWRKPA